MLPIDSFFIDSDRFAFFSAFVDSYEACSSSWKARQADNLVTKDYKIFLGNLTEEAVEVPPGELFGFGTGTFEVKLISGSVVR